MRRVLAVLLLALPLGLAACGFLPGAALDLDRTEWKAVLVAGRQPIADREPLLRFSGGFSGGQITGSGGCNQIAGRVTPDRGRIGVTELSGTAMGCDECIGDIEGLFMVALARAETVRMEGSKLVIAGSGGEIVLVRSLGG